MGRLGTNQPNRKRTARELQKGRQFKDKLVNKPTATSSQNEREARRRAEAKKTRRQRIMTGISLVALAGAGVAAMIRDSKNAPVDVTKLPRNEIVKVHVPRTGQSEADLLPSTIAGDISSINTATVSDEIASQVGEDGEAAPGQTLLLPRNQVDSTLLEKYEHGQDS